MADIKLIGFDLDGTLLTGKKEISEYTADVIKQLHRAGMQIAITTGRPIAAIGKFLQQLELSQPEDYTLTFNGALVINNVTKEPIFKLATTKADLTPLYTWLAANDYPMDVLDFDQNWQIAGVGKSDYVRLMQAPLLFEYVTFAELPDQPYAKAVVSTTKERLDDLLVKMPAELQAQYHIVRSQPHILEFLQPTLDKKVGVKALAEHYGLTAENVMVFGDAENDLGMFEYAGTAVAMANATDEAKATANAVTAATNDEDGIGKFLADYFALV
ncbi:HAD family phosphatase [Periweissella cryptocerci]|uniref:HAD family phosphatase n=1 Tax=Periweissella cryptocerci TaxID=2506420 RepID=A0A4P6YUD1_9LACO|nr:Cof-type HAD-IIB family hydrolase [Periweissella cryptocerci]QBO36313.1 HAD family phosphatase [Periweissella cryptocerci]